MYATKIIFLQNIPLINHFTIRKIAKKTLKNKYTEYNSAGKIFATKKNLKNIPLTKHLQISEKSSSKKIGGIEFRGEKINNKNFFFKKKKNIPLINKPLHNR